MSDISLFGHILTDFVLLTAWFGVPIMVGFDVADRSDKNWHGTVAGLAAFCVLALIWRAVR